MGYSPASRSTYPARGETVKYEAPQVTDYGNLAELTAGQTSGNVLDATFPAGTPKEELTFS